MPEDPHHLQLYNIEDGELGDDEDSVNESNYSESESEHTREFLIPRDNDDQLRLIVTATQRPNQEQIKLLEEQLQECKARVQILTFELGRKYFFEDKQKRSEKLFQIPRAHLLTQNTRTLTADGAAHVEGNSPGGSGPLDRQELSK